MLLGRPQQHPLHGCTCFRTSLAYLHDAFVLNLGDLLEIHNSMQGPNYLDNFGTEPFHYIYLAHGIGDGPILQQDQGTHHSLTAVHETICSTWVVTSWQLMQNHHPPMQEQSHDRQVEPLNLTWSHVASAT